MFFKTGLVLVVEIGAWVCPHIAISGQDGKDGQDGVDGQDGKDGTDGSDDIFMGIIESEDGKSITFVLRDGQTFTVPIIK